MVANTVVNVAIRINSLVHSLRRASNLKFLRLAICHFNFEALLRALRHLLTMSTPVNGAKEHNLCMGLMGYQIFRFKWQMVRYTILMTS